MEHLDAIDDLREGIGLRGYGQRDPLVEYKNEAFSMFERLMSAIDNEIIHRIYKVQIALQQPQTATYKAPKGMPKKNSVPAQLNEVIQTETKLTKEAKRARTNEEQAVAVSQAKKQLGRNDPCWCGSGKKWKKCHYPQLN
jgi:preprotein translocase subunit SecA